MKKALSRSIATAVMAISTTSVFAGTITGSALYRERIILPPNAVFEVTLQDVSLADAPAKIIARSDYISGGTVPLRFSLSFDDKVIVPGHSYAVRATIRHEDALLFTTDTHVPAFETNGPLTLNLVHVAGHATQTVTTPDFPLRNTYWKLIELNSKAVEVAERQREPHLIFAEKEARVSGSGGCNSIMGGFDVDNHNLSFKQMAGTMMACTNGMEQESAFLKALTTVTGFQITGNTLELRNASKTVIARFIAVTLK